MNRLRFPVLISLFLFAVKVSAQAILPPTLPWSGKSESLISKPNNLWITPVEKSDFKTTPSYEETLAWLKKLTDSSPMLSMVSIGKSPEGRDIMMVIASMDKNISAEALKTSKKPLLLVQAGIHSGEIDGKDAGMMLLRDLVFGGKKDLISQVNFLFIPILSVDAHERTSPYNRVNQRGPDNMGWRTNAQNLNLNRDYAKLDTKEVQAVVQVINAYDPLMYMDIHVTDGADYQYDITFGGLAGQGYSSSISNWLATTYKSKADVDLQSMDHIPGQLLFAINDRDFSEGNVLVMGGPRFSDSYGDLRHMATVLVENHSLKPYKQRVLGTYVLLESTLKTLATEGQNLKSLTQKDQDLRAEEIPLSWKVPQMKGAVSFENQGALESRNGAVQAPDSMKLLGISSRLVKSTVTNSDYIEWLGKPETMTVASYRGTEGVDIVSRPKGYWVPASCVDVINRLKIHGIRMETTTTPKEVDLEMYRIKDAKFENEGGSVAPFEGHMQVAGTPVPEKRKQVFPTGSVYISTDQPLGDLAIVLLEPTSRDSFFSWGFFHSIFQRTEYIEAYVIEPMAKKMLEESPALRAAFEQKKKSDPAFANDPNEILTWFYSKTKYYDERYLLYPVGRVL